VSNSERQKSEETSASRNLKQIYEGRIITVNQETLTLQNGKESRYDIVKHPGAVAILPIDETGRILFIKQWRRAAETILIEIPAGTLEKNETPLECAHREVDEETGFGARKMTPLGGFYTAPGFCSEYIHLFIAEDLFPGSLSDDDSEYIDLLPLTLEQAVTLIKQGAFIDGKTLAAVTLYNLWLADRKGKR